MERHLLELIDYQDVLAVVAATADGLIVAMTGLSGDDAEVIAAAGSAVARALRLVGERSGVVDIRAGRLHVVVGDELMLVALTESQALEDALHPVMREALDGLASELLQGRAEG